MLHANQHLGAVIVLGKKGIINPSPGVGHFQGEKDYFAHPVALRLRKTANKNRAN